MLEARHFDNTTPDLGVTQIAMLADPATAKGFMRPLTLNRFETLFFLVLCGKLYFLFGFQPGTHSTSAPLWIVACRDILLVAWIALGARISRCDFFDFLRKSIYRPYVIFFISALTISALQFMGPKAPFEILQHYLRNCLLPSMIFIVAIHYFRNHGALNFRRVLGIFAIVNVFFSFLELYFWKDLMWVTRPTGIIGDPLLNSTFLFLSIAFLSFRTWQSTLFSTFALISGGMVLFAASSVSSFLAWGAAWSFVYLIQSRTSNQPLSWKRMRPAVYIVSVLTFSLIIFSRWNVTNEALDLNNRFDQKFNILYESLTCQSENCSKPDVSVTGRIVSNLAAIRFCQTEPLGCLWGAVKLPGYARLDSTWASLTLNWGLLFMILYHFVFGILPFRKILKIKTWTKDIQFSVSVFFFYWAFSLVNAVIYKYPLNLLFYVCTAFLMTRSEKESQSNSNR